jgi:RimJ/RimL family protein N-acetyltransferase
MIIKPYLFDHRLGKYSIPDQEMVAMFEVMQANKIDERTFGRQVIKHEDAFLSLVQNPKNVVHVVYNENGQESLALAWLNGFGCNYAMGHFCCFPVAWKNGLAREAIKNSLKYWFSFKRYENNMLLDVIVGQIPSDNKMAINFSKKIGMVEVGKIPLIASGNAKTGVTVMYITREQLKWDQS